MNTEFIGFEILPPQVFMELRTQLASKDINQAILHTEWVELYQLRYRIMFLLMNNRYQLITYDNG